MFVALLLFARSRADTARLSARLEGCERVRQQLKDGSASTYAAELGLLGRRLKWSSLELLSTAPADRVRVGRLRLVLLVSDISCNVCQDRETQFAQAVARRFGPGAVEAIVAGDARFVSAYARVNRASFPIYVAPAEDLAANGLPALPLLLLTDEGRIVLAHQPHPGQEPLATAFHATAERLLAEARGEVARAR